MGNDAFRQRTIVSVSTWIGSCAKWGDEGLPLLYFEY